MTTLPSFTLPTELFGPVWREEFFVVIIIQFSLLISILIGNYNVFAEFTLLL
jgi:hypothetical protein